MSDSSYDMRKKLLELQSELLRNSSSNSQPAPAPAPSPKAPSTQQIDNMDSTEIKSMLKELLENQQLMLKILMELKNKVK